MTNSQFFSQGYYNGVLEDLNADSTELNQRIQEIYSFASDMNKNFEYFNIAESLPHRIPYAQKAERLQYLQDHPEILYCNSSNILIENEETSSTLLYFKNLIQDFIPSVYPDLTSDKITTSYSIQMYEEGDFQAEHTDDHVGDCVVIVYLSDPSTYNNSGQIQFLDPAPSDNVIDAFNPVLGNFIMLELTEHNPRHRVQRVTGDFKRFSFLAQVRRLDDPLI